jgi:hypothetical protein
MPIAKLENMAHVAPELERTADETSNERFDRTAFARHALDLVRPRAHAIAICEGASCVRVEWGRAWGHGPSQRWALLAIPPDASRRAIALAVIALARAPRPYALDALLR